MCSPFRSSGFERPLGHATAAHFARLKRDCLKSEAVPRNVALSLPLKWEELGWVLTSERPHPAHFARVPLPNQTRFSRELGRSIVGQIGYVRLRLGEVREEHARDLT